MKDKGIAALIVAKAKPPVSKGMSGSADEADMDQDDENNEGLKSVADEIMQAVESKDSSALVEALKSFKEMCSY